MKRPIKNTELVLPVVGMKHRISVSTRRMIESHVEETTMECNLLRERDNVHDENAIKVVIVTKPYQGFHIGYIQREVAAVMAPMLDSGDATVAACVLTEWNSQEATADLAVIVQTPAQAKKKAPKKKSR